MATLINIGTQKILELFLDEIFKLNIYNIEVEGLKNITYRLLFQMTIATITAFIFKYLADKIFIFKDKTKYLSLIHFRQILLYGFFAVFTTGIFWFAELSFKYLFSFKNSHLIGAVVGLAIGYTIKFFLDKKFVFVDNDI